MTATINRASPAASLATARQLENEAQRELALAAAAYSDGWIDTDSPGSQADADERQSRVNAIRNTIARLDRAAATRDEIERRLTILQRAAHYAAAAYAAAYTTATSPTIDDDDAESPIIVADAAAAQMASDATGYPYNCAHRTTNISRDELRLISDAARYTASTDGRIDNDWPHPYSSDARRLIEAARQLGLISDAEATRASDLAIDELGPDNYQPDHAPGEGPDADDADDYSASHRNA